MLLIRPLLATGASTAGPHLLVAMCDYGLLTGRSATTLPPGSLRSPLHLDPRPVERKALRPRTALKASTIRFDPLRGPSQPRGTTPLVTPLKLREPSIFSSSQSSSSPSPSSPRGMVNSSQPAKLTAHSLSPGEGSSCSRQQPLPYFFGDKTVRFENAFTWAPIAEVATLAIGIFSTMAPALRFTSNRSLLPFRSTDDLLPLLWLTLLSLDNAPYAFFRNGESWAEMESSSQSARVLPRCISLGAVLCRDHLHRQRPELHGEVRERTPMVAILSWRLTSSKPSGGHLVLDGNGSPFLAESSPICSVS